MEMQNEDRWVADRIATLAPAWRPDRQAAGRVLESRLTVRRPKRLWIAAAAAACLVVATLPATRAGAQELWMRLTVSRIDVVRLDLSNSPLRSEISSNGMTRNVSGLDEAERLAGFRPYLPTQDVLGSEPGLSVIGQLEVTQTAHVRDIEAALAKAGAGEVPVPPEWEGVTLRARLGPMVAAHYSEDLEVLQARPVEMLLPPGFPLEHFAEVVFRSLGMARAEAIAMARRLARDPAWLFDIPADEVANVQELNLRNGTALVIEEFEDRGALQRVTVIRSTQERTYSVSTNRRDVAIRVAESLP
jgi:hypothetical protein